MNQQHAEQADSLPTYAQTVALRAVRDGLVRVTAIGCRDYPRYVRAASLDAAHRRDWWRWVAGDPVARLTSAGQRALGRRGV
jgi:hypothetical protein